MNLLLDVGNSRIKWAVSSTDGTMDGPHVLDGDPERAAARAWADLQPERVVYCSVADAVATGVLVAWMDRTWGVRPHRLRSAASAAGVTNGYAQPESLGDDRWANLLGARTRWRDRDCVLIDAGTAVTVDGLKADGRHVGGAILPGLPVWRTALVAAAPALPAGGGVERLPATNTADAVAGGTLYGLAGAIRHVADCVAAGMGDPYCVVTGGDAEYLMPRLPADWVHDPLLTLRGLCVEGRIACAG